MSKELGLQTKHESPSESLDFFSPEFEAEVASHAPKLRGRKLTAALAFVSGTSVSFSRDSIETNCALLTGTGFTLFGYVDGLKPYNDACHARHLLDMIRALCPLSSLPDRQVAQFLCCIYALCLTVVMRSPV